MHTKEIPGWKLPAPRASRLIGLTLLAVAWQAVSLGKAVAHGRRLARQALPCESHPADVCARVLVLGDSTGAGVGAASAEASLPGLLAAEFPHATVVNFSTNGARVADLSQQLKALRRSQQPFHFALVMAGGNDVLRLTPLAELRAQAHALLQELRQRVRHVVWLGCADIGNAPALKPPLSWVASWRCRRVSNVLRAVSALHGVEFIDFGSPRHSRTFLRQPRRYFAEDGLHPSASSYRHCFDELGRRVPLAHWLRATTDTRHNRQGFKASSASAG